MPAEVTPRVLQWIAALDDDEFTIREKASKELEELGHQAEMSLLRASKNARTLEFRRRVEILLEKLDADSAPAMMREVRALKVLERISSLESSKILEHVAGGAADARLTREAKLALTRMGP